MNKIRLLNEIDPNCGTAPSWAYGALLYQIFPDRFCNGNPENDAKTAEYIYGSEYDEGPIPIRRTDWDELPQIPDVGNFHGGDLQGILAKLPHLKVLGVEAIYLNPIFVSPSNHKYDVADYEHVDPHLTTGDISTTNEFFADFVSKCHEAGIRVILDGVFNHCSSSHYFYREAIEHPESPYRNYFLFDENGEAECWWDVKTLPKFNYEGSEELCNYIYGIAAKWVSPPYCCDGWRLDVAADISHSEEFNHKFWKDFRKAVKEANPEAVIIAEHYEDPSAWLCGDEWDTVMNYRGFMDPVSYFMTGVEKHSDHVCPEKYADVSEFCRAMETSAAELCPTETSGQTAAFTAMNQLDNHDHSRFITRTTRKAGVLGRNGAIHEWAKDGINMGLYSSAVMLMMTWPGSPCIYYGDETGLPGFTDPDSRRAYPWGHENPAIIDFFSCAATIHRMPLFRYGSLTILSGEGHVLMYLREYKGETGLVLINPTGEEMTVSIPAADLSDRPSCELKMTRLLRTNDTSINAGHKKHRPFEENVIIHLHPYTSKVYLIV
ncbi:MAG: glycoside hydrolase family 13 protein [Lachnospiraceae bacterium]|nr:glycoside hydrolase family 13 protein [Lachnospiraceae bacterium]